MPQKNLGLPPACRFFGKAPLLVLHIPVAKISKTTSKKSTHLHFLHPERLCPTNNFPPPHSRARIGHETLLHARIGGESRGRAQLSENSSGNFSAKILITPSCENIVTLPLHLDFDGL
jgi:hypothetical protein